MPVTKHTPGPWREMRNGYTKKHISGLPVMTTVIESASAIVCELWDRRSADRVAPLNERQANARLIAAAPMLLELLKAQRERLGDGRNVEGWAAEWLEEIDAAIANAEGET